MAGKPKKAKSKKSTPKKAPADLSLDDLEGVTGGVVLSTPKVGTLAATLPASNCCSQPSALLNVDRDKLGYPIMNETLAC